MRGLPREERDRRREHGRRGDQPPQAGGVDRGQGRQLRAGALAHLLAAGEPGTAGGAVALAGGAEQLVHLVRPVRVAAVGALDALVAAPALGHLAEAARTRVQQRLERLPGAAAGRAPVVDRGQLMRLPRPVLDAGAVAGRTETHGAQPAPPCYRHQAAARSGTRTRPRPTRSSAIWTPFVAAPLRRLSATTNRLSPLRRDASSRMRPTRTSSVPDAADGRG